MICTHKIVTTSEKVAVRQRSSDVIFETFVHRFAFCLQMERARRTGSSTSKLYLWRGKDGPAEDLLQNLLRDLSSRPRTGARKGSGTEARTAGKGGRTTLTTSITSSSLTAWPRPRGWRNFSTRRYSPQSELPLMLVTLVLIDSIGGEGCYSKNAKNESLSAYVSLCLILSRKLTRSDLGKPFFFFFCFTLIRESTKL